MVGIWATRHRSRTRHDVIFDDELSRVYTVSNEAVKIFQEIRLAEGSRNSSGLKKFHGPIMCRHAVLAARSKPD